MKEKFNNILIHKILPIFALFLLVMSIFTTYSFSVTSSISFTDDKFGDFSLSFDVDFDYKYYLITRSDSSSSSSFYIHLSDSPFTIDVSLGRVYTKGSLYGDSFTSISKQFNDIKDGSFIFDNFTYWGIDVSIGSFLADNLSFIFSNHIIYDEESGEEIFKPVLPFQNPSFHNKKEELETGNFDYLRINYNDFDIFNDSLIFTVYDGYKIDEENYNYLPKTSFKLNFGCEYDTVEGDYFLIPKEKLNIKFENENRFLFKLTDSLNSDATTYDEIEFIVSNRTDGEIIKDKQDITNDKLDEQIETNKNIFERLGELLNFLNPFSPDFFVYKLIELLINAIKSLIIPSENFFLNWINDLNAYFGDRFGIIYYPFELLIEFLTRIGTVGNGNYTSAIIKFGDLSLFGATIINSFEFDFFSLLTNDTLKNIHLIYLVCVDVILYLGLVLLCKNIFSEVFGGHFVDEVINDTTADERSYSNYERYQGNKERYKKEHGGGK